MVPRPRSRTPPAPSSVIDRYRPWCAARSSRSSAFSASRSALSGSASSTRRLAACAEVGGVQPGRLPEQHRLGVVAHPGVQGELLDRGHDHRGLLRRDPAGQHRRVGGGPLADQDRRLLDGAVPLAAGGPGEVGEPVRGRPPGQLLLRDLAGRHLGQHRRLDRGQVRPQRLGLGHGVDQLLGASSPPTACRPGVRPGCWQPRPPRRGWSAFRSAAPWRYSTRGHRQCRPLTCGYPQNQTSFEKRFEDFTLALGSRADREPEGGRNHERTLAVASQDRNHPPPASRRRRQPRAALAVASQDRHQRRPVSRQAAATGYQPDVPGSPLNGPTTRLVTQPP